VARIATATGEANSNESTRQLAAEAPRLVPLAFADISGWSDDDHAAAFAAFRQGTAVLADHPPQSRSLGTDAAALTMILMRAAALPSLDTNAARVFFEAEFAPHEVAPATTSPRSRAR
jgi:membrane-bound lytic murein transglycosylase A